MSAAGPHADNACSQQTLGATAIHNKLQQSAHVQAVFELLYVINQFGGPFRQSLFASACCVHLSCLAKVHYACCHAMKPFGHNKQDIASYNCMTSLTFYIGREAHFAWQTGSLLHWLVQGAPHGCDHWPLTAQLQCATHSSAPQSAQQVLRSSTEGAHNFANTTQWPRWHKCLLCLPSETRL